MRPVTCFALSLLCAATVPPIGWAQGVSRETTSAARPIRQVKHISRPFTSGVKAAASSVTIPFWSATQGSYTYQMVGENPMVQQTTQTTTIPTVIVPLAITIANGASSVTFDPTVSNACNTAGSALSLLEASPIFMNSTYTVGGTSFGSTLYHDFFQRANFWQYTNLGTGTNPNYHILLSASANAAIKIAAPSGSSSVVAASCGQLGQVDVNWLDLYLQGTVMPELSAAGVTPANFVVFLLNNVVMYEGITSDCCVIGYHSAFSNSAFGGATETYAVGDFDTSRDFGATQDTAALSHEIGEWMDDPLGNNPTPPWGNIGQVTGCQNNLEVGDPLSGTDITVPMSNGYSYHLQELAFVSWFYRQSPSTGVNGWYSSNGTFTKPAGPCQTSTTTLSISPTSLSPGSAATVSIKVAAGTGASGTPTGTVTLVPSTTSSVLATYTLSNGVVSATTTALPSGSYSVTAKYAGDANFEASVSPAVSVTVGTPSVSLSPVSLTFASQSVGAASSAQIVTLTNNGNAPLTGIVVSLTGASPGDYSQTNTCSTSVAVGASCKISVTFKPTAAGTRTASVSVADNASGSPQTVPLSGTGVAGTPAVALSPTSLTFASTTVGVGSASQTITVTNSGTASLGSVSISITGTNASDFSQTHTCGTTLAAGSKCTVSVTFKPTAAGARSASLSVADNATGSPQTASLAGTGVAAAPAVTLSPTSLTFASTAVGIASAAQAVKITNSGTGSLASLAISITGTNASEFSQTTTCGASIAAGSNCSVSVTFKPSATGAASATLSIADNATGSPQTVSLSGTGIAAAPKVTLSAAALTFTSTKVGTSATAQKVTVTNSGTATLSSLAFSIGGTNASDFSQTSTCGSSLAVSAACTISVTFKPAATGTRVASLNIADNATGSPQTVALSGTGK